MDRRDRLDYDRNDRNYSGGARYSSDDAHYHSARNLTNDFEQHYRSSHPDEDRGSRRMNQDREYDRYTTQRSRYGNDYGSSINRDSDYSSRLQQGTGASGNYGSRSHRSSDYDRDNRYTDRNNDSSSNSYGTGNRYSDYDRNADRYSSGSSSSNRRYNDSDNTYGNSDRYSRRSQNQGDSSYSTSGSSYGSRQYRSGENEGDRYSSSQGRMSEDRRRQGYGISDYDDMRDSSVRSSRGIPNEGITSGFADDYGSRLDRDRNYGLSSGNFGGYGSHSGDYRRSGSDRFRNR